MKLYYLVIFTLFHTSVLMHTEKYMNTTGNNIVDKMTSDADKNIRDRDKELDIFEQSNINKNIFGHIYMLMNSTGATTEIRKTKYFNKLNDVVRRKRMWIFEGYKQQGPQEPPPVQEVTDIEHLIEYEGEFEHETIVRDPIEVLQMAYVKYMLPLLREKATSIPPWETSTFLGALTTQLQCNIYLIIFLIYFTMNC